MNISISIPCFFDGNFEALRDVIYWSSIPRFVKDVRSLYRVRSPYFLFSNQSVLNFGLHTQSMIPFNLLSRSPLFRLTLPFLVKKSEEGIWKVRERCKQCLRGENEALRASKTSPYFCRCTRNLALVSLA